MQLQATRKTSENRFWVWLRWLTMLPGACLVFFAGGIFGGVIGRLFVNRFDSCAVVFCGVYTAILAGAFIAPVRWQAAKIVSVLGLALTVIAVACLSGAPVEEGQPPPYIVGLIACMAISAGFITVRRWQEDNKKKEQTRAGTLR